MHTWNIQSTSVCFQYLQSPLYQLRTEDVAQSTLALKVQGQEFNPLTHKTTTKHLIKDTIGPLVILAMLIFRNLKVCLIQEQLKGFK